MNVIMQNRHPPCQVISYQLPTPDCREPAASGSSRKERCEKAGLRFEKTRSDLGKTGWDLKKTRSDLVGGTRQDLVMPSRDSGGIRWAGLTLQGLPHGIFLIRSQGHVF